jgi:hypothetical protein
MEENTRTLDNRQALIILGCENAVVFDNPSFDTAIIGTTYDGRVVYSHEKMVDELVDKEGMTTEEAEDFISYNTIRSLPYIENPPVIVFNTACF